MSRVRNQEDFIAKAKEIHNNKYDYSLVQYVKTSMKVQIICPIHGVFEQTPNCHLDGKGCRQCGREATKTGRDAFIEKARTIHNDKYDYSKVVYQSSCSKVEIICPIHGSFWQTPHCHNILKQNCPHCSAEAGGQKRLGENNVARRQDVKDKKRQTCIDRYNAKTWAESDEGRKRLHEIIVDEGKLDAMKMTCNERYGTDFWTQSDEGKAKLHDIMSSDEMHKKVRSGYEAVYGMHYMQTDAGKERAKSYIDDERREKMRQTMIERYGVPYAVESEGVREKIRQTCIDRYGVPYVLLSDEERQAILKKSWETKRRNGTFNSSKPEETLYLMLCDVFGKDDVFRQYDKDSRYPFNCDFYVKSIDLFIELNAHWSHGGHWFDENNENDIAKLTEWQEKCKKKGSSYYYSAIYIWTKRDLLKKKTAEDNNLNYPLF